MDDDNTDLLTLEDDMLDHVAGGWVQALGLIATIGVTYKQSYETANFYGANTLGNWLGSEVYDLFNEY